MAAEIIADITDGAIFESSASGQNLVRVFYVGGVTPTMDALVQIFNGGGVGGVNLPYMGQAHPTIFGLIAMGFRCVPLKDKSRTGIMVYVSYGPMWTVEVQGDSSMEVFTTWPVGHPLANLPILIPYCSASGSRFTLPIDPRGLNVDPTTNNGPGNPGTIYQIGQSLRLSDKMNVSFTTISGISPFSLSKTYRGKINSVVWQGGAENTWLCRSIDGINVPQPWGFTVWRSTFAFTYNAETWATANKWLAETGKPPPDVSFDPANPLSGNGLFLIPDGLTIDFNALGLPTVL